MGETGQSPAPAAKILRATRPNTAVSRWLALPLAEFNQIVTDDGPAGKRNSGAGQSGYLTADGQNSGAAQAVYVIICVPVA